MSKITNDGLTRSGLSDFREFLYEDAQSVDVECKPQNNGRPPSCKSLYFSEAERVYGSIVGVDQRSYPTLSTQTRIRTIVEQAVIDLNRKQCRGDVNPFTATVAIWIQL